MMDDAKWMAIAYEEALKGYNEGGIPIGAALVSADGVVLGRGHNERLQKNNPILHAETSALQDAGNVDAALYKGATMYSTLASCFMCSGACILYGINRVVMGENRTVTGGEELLVSKGIELINLDDAKCYELMQKFIRERPEAWHQAHPEEFEVEEVAA
ncbi:cytidine deaminase-like protein [Dipodascopsis tothii]|uniref:cytidine deaminase-like protein n=1 Tax=Dipodascopsis tothii TaxID=44089 RepID=UPI0034CFFD14